MDQHKLRSLVFEKTGVRVDIDDPIFALVALNEAVLAEAVERHVALIDAASQELVRHARNAGGIGAAGRASAARSAGAPSIDASAAVHAPTPALPVRAIAKQSPLFTPREWRLLGAAGGVSLLCALLVLAGQALFFTPKPASIVQVQAKTLTPEQSAAIANGEKLSRAVQKLDLKTRAQIQAELQKP